MKTIDIIIRAEEPRDYPKVYNVNFDAFGRSEEAQLVDRLRGGDAFVDGLSLVATVDNVIVGHILFSKINIVAENKTYASLALAPMAVLPQYQKMGIGAQLVVGGLEKAREIGYESVIVLGHDSFYPRFGFAPANRWGIKAPFNVPEASFMAIELKKNALSGVNGVVKYCADFDSI